MSGLDYRSRPGYAKGSQPDYVKGRPIISYDAARNTRSYVTRIESSGGASYNLPNSHLRVDTFDPTMEENSRPPEVQDFITKILDEVNGAPDFANIPDPGPKWGPPSSPVKRYPTKDHGYNNFAVKSRIFGYHGDPYEHAHGSPGHDYDHPPQNNYGVPKNRYFDQSHPKLEASKDYEAPKNRERSQHPLYDPQSQYDREVPNKQWDNSHVYDNYFPKYQSTEMPKHHGGTYSRKDNPTGKHQSPNNQGIPSNHRLSSYDQPPHTRNGGGAPTNYGTQFPQDYGLSSYQHERPSSPLHDQPFPKGYTAGAQYPKVHGAHDDQWERSTSPIHSRSPPTKSTSGGIPNNHWGDSSTNSQSPKGYKVSKNQWDRSSSPVYDRPPPTKSVGGNPGVSNKRWGNSSMYPQSPTRHGVSNNQWDRTSSPGRGVPNNQWDRTSSPSHDHPLPTKSTTGIPGVSNSRWSNSPMNPQPPKGYGASNNQWDRSTSPVHDPPLPTKGIRSLPGVSNRRWGDSSSNPQSPKGHGVPSNQWDRSSSPAHDPQLPTKSFRDVPNNRWGNSLMKPQSPKDHGVTNNQWDRSLSPANNNPPSPKKTWGDPSVPTTGWDNPSMKPQSRNEWNRPSSPVHDHSPPTLNTTKFPNNKLGNSSMRPQSPKKASNHYDNRQPEEYNRSSNEKKPNGYFNPPKMAPASVGPNHSWART